MLISSTVERLVRHTNTLVFRTLFALVRLPLYVSIYSVSMYELRSDEVGDHYIVIRTNSLCFVHDLHPAQRARLTCRLAPTLDGAYAQDVFSTYVHAQS